MSKLVEDFKLQLAAEGKSNRTVSSYGASAQEYVQWYKDTFGAEMEKMYASNLSDYVSFLRTVKGIRGTGLNPKVAGLKSFNKFLISTGIQTELVVNEKHRDKVQGMGISPSTVDQADVDAFLQRVLAGNGVRDYAIVTMLAYGGPRVSEAVNLKLAQVDMVGREFTIYGKGNKVRVVDMARKVHHALEEYLKARSSVSPYLFVSRQAEKFHRSSVNRICEQYSDVITPHVLRHFFCEHALGVGYSLAQVAYMAGHSSVRTTSIYLSANRKQMKELADLL